MKATIRAFTASGCAIAAKVMCAGYDLAFEPENARHRDAECRIRLVEELVLGNQQQRRRPDCAELSGNRGRSSSS